LAPEVDRNHPAIRALIMAGGVSQGLPFVAGVERGPNGMQPAVLRTQPYEFLIRGGEESGAPQLFVSRAEAVLSTIDPSQFSREAVTRIVDAAGETIRLVESVDPTVGGVVTYALIRDNEPPEQHAWGGAPTGQPDAVQKDAT
jgi:CubicO group peptidase (beta-lactamase class C family)